MHPWVHLLVLNSMHLLLWLVSWTSVGIVHASILLCWVWSLKIPPLRWLASAYTSLSNLLLNLPHSGIERVFSISLEVLVNLSPHWIWIVLVVYLPLLFLFNFFGSLPPGRVLHSQLFLFQSLSCWFLSLPLNWFLSNSLAPFWWSPSSAVRTRLVLLR